LEDGHVLILEKVELDQRCLRAERVPAKGHLLRHAEHFYALVVGEGCDSHGVDGEEKRLVVQGNVAYVGHGLEEQRLYAWYVNDLCQGVDSVKKQLPEAEYMGGFGLQVLHTDRGIHTGKKKVRFAAIRDAVFTVDGVCVFAFNQALNASQLCIAATVSYQSQSACSQSRRLTSSYKAAQTLRSRRRVLLSSLTTTQVGLEGRGDSSPEISG